MIKLKRTPVIAVNLAICGLLALPFMTVTADDDKTAHVAHQATTQQWTPAALRRALKDMPVGDVQRGRELNSSMMCMSCHGEQGVAPTGNWPHVAGQKADYTYKMLLDYQSGLRSEDGRSQLMTILVQVMTQQDMADVAAYYATLSAPDAVQTLKTDAEQQAQAESLVRKGDPKRLITPCASCHGVQGQGGKNATPALAGQNPQAFVRTMQLYKSGARNNDVHQGMAQFAQRLTDTEIDWLAQYYAQQ